MRIAILTSEAVPFAKTGGLADVSGALPKALVHEGVDAKLILPLYDQIDRWLLNGGSIENVRVEWRGHVHRVRFWYSDAAGAPAYFLEAPEFFARSSIYGHDDDHIRFAFFSRAALGLLKALDWQPDVVHGNDWPCGFATAELRARRRHEAFFQNTRSLFSLHNVGYQGLFSAGDLWWLGFGDPPERNDFTLERHASALKAGIIAADALSTVSPRYAREIQSPEQGHGLDWLLRARNNRLAGITNGVDYEIWNPETDPHIASNFSVEDLSGKRECKIDLLRRFGLPEEPERPILAIISRLVGQKGYDLIRQISGS
ncbi:MAG TPA: glycogen/starch synthase, partial [Pyrinomonadaceae bacterium]|nr:glycogen/starch synthase [Pyrinomonadaceae bacterium]